MTCPHLVELNLSFSCPLVQLGVLVELLLLLFIQAMVIFNASWLSLLTKVMLMELSILATVGVAEWLNI